MSRAVGGSWTWTGSAANLSVDGVGKLRLGAAGKQAVYLASVSAARTDLMLGLSLDKPPTGGGVQTTTFGRRVSGQGGYGARVKLDRTGAVTLELIRESATGTDSSLQPPVSTGVSYAVGDTVNVRIQVIGAAPTTIRARVWKAGTAEPTTWQRSVVDSTGGLQGAGSVGFSSYISSSASNAPITVRIDDLVAAQVP